MNFESSKIEMMSKRHSVRTYDVNRLTNDDLRKIHNYLTFEQNLIGPLKKRGKIEFIQVTKNTTEKGIKLGTYGFIKDPQGYLVGICENNKYSLVDFAFTFQKLVLYMTELGLGTCWMGGTFSRTSFERELSLMNGTFIPCVTPIGYPKDKPRVFDKALRYVVKADNKKNWDQLFFNSSFEQPLLKEEAGTYKVPIEMVRLGPSASNKQPWRLVLSKDLEYCHFFIEHTPNYSTKLGYDMQLLDMGIAMCQFELACNELNIEGEWIIEDPKLKTLNEQTEYIISWKSH